MAGAAAEVAGPLAQNPGPGLRPESLDWPSREGPQGAGQWVPDLGFLRLCPWAGLHLTEPQFPTL